MVDMRSIINVIKDLRNTVTLMENRASGNRDEVERLKQDVLLLELWAGLTSDTDGNCNIQHVSDSCSDSDEKFSYGHIKGQNYDNRRTIQRSKKAH